MKGLQPRGMLEDINFLVKIMANIELLQLRKAMFRRAEGADDSLW
jgi:hypothetical protein